MGQYDLDLIGLKFTIPIIKLAAAVKLAAPGDVFNVKCDYEKFDTELERWCAATGHILENISHDHGVFNSVIRKKPAP